jgi:hypothetical protein
MGWDAYAVRPEVDPRTSDERFLTPQMEAHFREASEKLSSIAGCRSDNLATGTLGGLSLGILARATGIPDYDDTSVDGWMLWSVDTVMEAHERAQWDSIPSDSTHPFLVAEARLFLDVCAAHGLAVWFDW